MAFLSPMPLLPSRIRKTRITKRSAYVPRASLNPYTATTPATAPKIQLPPETEGITDPAARRMLSNLCLTPIQTTLDADPIPTSHLTQTSAATQSKPPTLVFLHGFDSNLLEYRHLQESLTELSNTQHYIDILGWGFTHRPSGIEYTPCAKRDHLHAFLDHFGEDEVVLVGASLGGAVALDYALEYPDRVKGLLLIDAQVYTDRPQARIPKIVAELGAEVLRSAWLRRLAVGMSYEKARFRNEEVLRIGGAHCGMDGWKEATVGFILGEGYCLSQRVKEVNEKSLVIWGERDRVLPQKDRKRFSRDGFQVVTAGGCGHSPHIEDPVFIRGCLEQLLNTL